MRPTRQRPTHGSEVNARRVIKRRFIISAEYESVDERFEPRSEEYPGASSRLAKREVVVIALAVAELILGVVQVLALILG
jgi:hypothetical protein